MIRSGVRLTLADPKRRCIDPPQPNQVISHPVQSGKAISVAMQNNTASVPDPTTISDPDQQENAKDPKVPIRYHRGGYEAFLPTTVPTTLKIQIVSGGWMSLGLLNGIYLIENAPIDNTIEVPSNLGGSDCKYVHEVLFKMPHMHDWSMDDFDRKGWCLFLKRILQGAKHSLPAEIQGLLLVTYYL